MKNLFALILALLMLCACVAEKEPVTEQPEINEPGSNGPSEPVTEEPEEKKLFDPETERLMEILWNSEKPSETIAGEGYVFYGVEEIECLGYENLVSFAEKYPENREEIFYIASLRTTWELFKISYSEDERCWIYTEYWIDTFNDNERNERSFEISEIKIYDNRVSIYFKSGGKQVVYKLGSVQGLPMNNCSHPEQAHFIDIEIIRYINSEAFRTEYEKTHSEPYMTFDEYTNTLWSEEEECLMNIYHYIGHYGLDYGDFIAAYGSDERIAEIWGEADIKGYFEK